MPNLLDTWQSLVRNATPASATAGRVELNRGAANIPLNNEGRVQMDLIGREYGRSPITKIHTSTRDRALESAHTIAKYTNAPVQVHSNLDPWAMGALEGLPTDKTKRMVDQLRMSGANSVPPGRSPLPSNPAESFNSYTARYLPELASIMAQHQDGEREIVVNHGSDIRTARAWAHAGFPPDGTLDPKALLHAPSDTGETYRLARDEQGRWTLGPINVGNHKILPEGIYLQRHGDTDWNGPEDTVPNHFDELLASLHRANPSSLGAGPIPNVDTTS